MCLVLYLYFTSNFTLDMLLLTNINSKRHVFTTHARRTHVFYEMNIVGKTK